MNTNNDSSLDPVTIDPPPQNDPESTVTKVNKSDTLSHDSTIDMDHDMDTIGDNTETADQGQTSYSIYRYDWTHLITTSLASTQDRYNVTTGQSLTLDQPSNITPFHSTSSNTNNFFKSCQWSPDGTCLLTNSEDRMIRIFDM
ncbi:hypothetical protein BC941DRAFT_61739 [Chlamydoabsidia padenii]|nr:hypothetical protein BC941DRAFT_61739 [Chlamydoabsidia padenii]